MTVRRIVANIEVEQVDLARSFYCDVLGMRVAMDLGWVVTFAGDSDTIPQVSAATSGGSGTPMPFISVEVDDFDAVFDRATSAGFDVEYGPVDEPWGVRRFFVRDPFGKLVNVLTHI